MKIAIVGHVEWGRFMLVPHVANSGEIVHATDSWEEVAGGGGVAAVVLAGLADECIFFTSVGNDDLGGKVIKQLQAMGITVHASRSSTQDTREIAVSIDEHKERTITVLGDLKPNGLDSSLPWEKLSEMDAVYFVSGDEAALKAARRAKILVSTARTLPVLQKEDVLVDALVKSEEDTGESYADRDLSNKPTHLVTTAGIKGGYTDSGLTYEAELVPENEIVDTYGCGDSFAAGLTFALAQGLEMEQALRIAAHEGAEAAKRRGNLGTASL